MDDADLRAGLRPQQQAGGLRVGRVAGARALQRARDLHAQRRPLPLRRQLRVAAPLHARLARRRERLRALDVRAAEQGARLQ